MTEQQTATLSMQQRIEQTGAALAEIAPIVAAYYLGLHDNGVPKREAAGLTAEMQAALLAGLLGMEG